VGLDAAEIFHILNGETIHSLFERTNFENVFEICLNKFNNPGVIIQFRRIHTYLQSIQRLIFPGLRNKRL
jgi:hypothetical protein